MHNLHRLFPSTAYKQTPPPPSRKPRKALLSPRRTDSPPPPFPSSLAGGPGAGSGRPLGPEALAQLESALMEGDLLEVTLDETEQLWKLLCAARPPAGGLNFPEGDAVKVGGGGGVV